MNYCQVHQQSEQLSVVTDGENGLCVSARDDMRNLAPCNQEDADPMIFVHVADAFADGCHKILVLTVDIYDNIVVLAVHSCGLNCIW